MSGIKNFYHHLMDLMNNIDEGDQEPDDPSPQELLDAEERCPDVKFVKSCRKFFNEKGFLSAKQRNALRYSGTPNRKHNYEYGNEPNTEEDYE